MITAEACGKIIAEARKEQNLTQKDVAERLHITDRAVSKWERGLNFPDIGLMQELADVLGITVQRLLGLEENHPSVEETMDAVTVVAKGTEKKGVLIRDLILLTGVAVVDIFFLGGSIIFFLPIICAVVGVMLYGKRALLYKIFSLVYCLLPILLAIHDMLSRIKGNDIVDAKIRIVKSNRSVCDNNFFNRFLSDREQSVIQIKRLLFVFVIFL